MPETQVQPPSLLKRIGTFLALTLAFVLLTGLLVFILGLIAPVFPDVFQEPNLSGFLRSWVILLVSVLAAVWTVDKLQDKGGWAGLGFSAREMFRGLVTGSSTAFIILTLCFLVLLIGGWTQILSLSFVAPAFLGWLLFFLIQPLAEEVVMRSFLQNQLHRLFGPWIGLFGSALIFSLLHIGNNAFSWIAGLEIVTGGLLMGLLFLHSQNIWGAYAMHAVWNFYQSTVLGFAVSGMETYRLLSLKTAGPDWLTGGEFGLEGSILSLILLLVAIIYFWSSSAKEVPILALQDPPPAVLDQDL
ncbi:MAG: type II CAAX endopeptidase family protein [Bacteroidota bacterium]